MQRNAQNDEKKNEKQHRSHDEDAKLSQAAFELVLFRAYGQTRSDPTKNSPRPRRCYLRERCSADDRSAQEDHMRRFRLIACWFSNGSLLFNWK